MAKKSFWETAYEQSAMGSFFGAKKRLDNEDYEDEKEQRYLEGVRNNAVMSGLMSVGQGVNGILNPALQAAEIGDTTMYQYDIDNIAHLGTGPYYDFDQIGGDYANANINMKPIEASDVRGMTTKEKWGSVATGALSGAKAGWEVGGLVGAGLGFFGGFLGAGAGVLAGNRKAEREAYNLNNQAEIASSMAQKNFGAAFERVADYQNRKNQANIAKEGGKMSQAARSKHMTIQQFADNVLSKQNADKHSDMIKKHSFSAGGKTYNTHGGYFSPDIIKIDAGGTHEQNPFGGVQVGVDPMGIPNLVEEGEIIYDDYVFSDRLNASESLLKEFSLPEKYAGKSFAYIADKLSAEAKERSNDAISNNGMAAMYDRLMAAQDAHKAKLEEAKLKREMKKMSPEELEAMGQAIAMQAVPPEVEMMQQPEMMPMEQVPMMAANGGQLANTYKLGDRMIKRAQDEKERKRLEQERLQRQRLREDAERRQKQGPWVPTNPFYDNTFINNDWMQENDEQWDAWYNNRVINQTAEDGAVTEEGIPVLPTWQRYAGAGYNLLTGLHNMLQEPDRYQYMRFNPSYTYGDLALDRVEYNPYDFNLAVNQINASDAATRAQIANSGLGPATGATLLAQNYNAGRNLGNAYFQTQLANQQQKANAIAANNQAAQAEANFAYQRDAANTNIRNQYGLYNLQNAIQADYLNKQAESQKWQAVSQSLDSAATDLANIGRENFNFNMANTNPALFYGINPYSGRIFYERENVAADGGKLKKSNWMIDLLDAIDTMHSRRNKDTSNE